MDEVFAWAEDRRADNSRRFYQFLDEQRQVWTPSRIFNRCCVRWLADGSEHSGGDYGYGGFGFDDEYSFRNGCDGHRCGRDHPKITLSFDAERRTTVATLSHPLDPFVRYFRNRVGNGTAWPRSSDSYELNGYLRPNLTELRSGDDTTFGSHLVTVQRGALEESDAAFLASEQQRQRQQEEERASKRPRLSGLQLPAQFPPDRLEALMDIVVSHRLQDDLDPDPLSLHFMRQTCRLFRKVATDIARRRTKTLDLSITPLVNGTERFGQDKFDGYDSESWDIDGYDPLNDDEDGGGGVYRYEKCERVALAYHEGGSDSENNNEKKEVAFRPADEDSAAEFRWRSDSLFTERANREYDEVVEDDYAGQKMRVFWHPREVDLVKAERRYDPFDNPMPTLGILLGELSVGRFSSPQKGAVKRKMGANLSLEYEVVEAAEERIEPRMATYDDDEMIRYTGRIKISKLNVDFAALVRQHALKQVGALEREHGKTAQERPLTAHEKAYYSQVCLAAGKKTPQFF